MSKDSQYIILNPQLKVIGVTDINGATPFSADTITRQIADTDNTTDDVSTGVENFNTNNDPNANSKNWNHTGEITVAEGYPDSYKVAANNYLLYWDESAQHYYVMYISQEIDAGTDASGRHVNTYELENVLITNMNSYIPMKQTLTDANAETAFTTLFTGSNWKLDFQATSALLTTTEFDGTTNAMGYLQTMLQAYDVEMDAYAELYSDGNIKDLVVQIVDQLGTDKNHWVVDYGKNLTGITRTTVYSTVVTKLHIVGAGGETIASVNNGKDYLVDDDANRLYNPNWKNGTYLEGTVTFANVKQYQALKDLGKKQLELFNHPRISYEVTPTADFKPSLGDNIRGTDWKMTPELAIDARVISVTTSKADYTLNLAQFGEFVTLHPVIPSYLSKLTAIEQAMQDASSIKTTVLTPDGSDFADEKDKRFIMQAWEGKENITSYFDPKGFIWTDILSDGTYDQSFVPDTLNGYLLKIHHDYSGNTVRAQFDTRYLSTNPEIQLNEPGSTLLGDHNTVDAKAQMNGIAEHAMQYCQQLKDGTYISSHSFTNTLVAKVPVVNYVHWKSDLKTVIEYMIVGNGGHGASFGVDYDDDGNPWIWSSVKDTTNKTYPICHFKYLPGTNDTWQNRSKKNDFMVYASPTYYDAINYDQNSGYIGLRNNASGTYSVLNVSDVKAGKIKPLYTIKYSNFGYDSSLQTYQSQCLNFPYVYFHSGNYDGHDIPTMYGLNVVTNSPEFVYQYDFATITKTGTYPEPETLNIFDDDNLLVGFNMGKAADGLNHEVLWKVPITHRAPMTAIDDTLAVDDDDDETDDADVTDTTDVTEGGD